MQSVRKGDEMEKQSNKSTMFLAMLLAAASVSCGYAIEPVAMVRSGD